ncbi:MAG: phage DNA encapsidation protein, partial [Erysipelotrichaceae bacterium]|nr:phage DNA encapsidation protein [Erysipelotrichaceae bacterium]
MSKSKFYSLDAILEKKCQYNMIIGERSNGKSYSVLSLILENWHKKGEQGAYIRRWKEDFKGKRAIQLFAGHSENKFISDLTDDEWNDVKFVSGKWYLCKYDDTLDKMVTQDEPFCFAFALSDMEHDKSTSYPRITTIAFDEFLTRSYYLPDEFILFMNVLSTIIRHRDNVTIFMMANTVNKYAPYFKEMGLRHIAEMEMGKIDIYSYGQSDLKVAVEYCKPPNKDGKKSDVYFAFDNPSLSMIT